MQAGGPRPLRPYPGAWHRFCSYTTSSCKAVCNVFKSQGCTVSAVMFFISVILVAAAANSPTAFDRTAPYCRHNKECELVTTTCGGLWTIVNNTVFSCNEVRQAVNFCFALFWALLALGLLSKTETTQTMFRTERQVLISVLFGRLLLIAVVSSSRPSALALAIDRSFDAYLVVWWTLYILSPIPSEINHARSREGAQMYALVLFTYSILVEGTTAYNEGDSCPHYALSLSIALCSAAMRDLLMGLLLLAIMIYSWVKVNRGSWKETMLPSCRAIKYALHTMLINILPWTQLKHVFRTICCRGSSSSNTLNQRRASRHCNLDGYTLHGDTSTSSRESRDSSLYGIAEDEWEIRFNPGIFSTTAVLLAAFPMIMSACAHLKKDRCGMAEWCETVYDCACPHSGRLHSCSPREIDDYVGLTCAAAWSDTLFIILTPALLMTDFILHRKHWANRVGMRACGRTLNAIMTGKPIAR